MADPAAMASPPDGMVFVEGGTFRMGSADFYPEERPVRDVQVDGFWMDEHPVTIGQFRRFVKDTGYETLAQRPLDPDDYPDADPALLVPGSLVFHPTSGPVSLDDYRAWWNYVPGACWERPEGPESDTYTRGRHPVVHVAYEDAAAYAAWASKALPTEAEWEHAARGGLEGATFCWGDEFMPAGRLMANTWHGQFPHDHQRPDEWVRTSPVATYPPNGAGLYDMAGNVWEWTNDWYEPRGSNPAVKSCCMGSVNPRVISPEKSYDPRQPQFRIPRKVVKGGSHLCAPNYCFRYRPAARQPQMIDTGMAHMGFRCVVRDASR
jgi:formylglycine-generating enzyme required for sulfatase activity